MKGIHDILSRLDETLKKDKLPFQKDKPEKQKISFEGFWTENFSSEAIKHKWADWRESFRGDGEEAVKKRRTAAIKSVLICISVLLALLGSLVSEYYFRENGCGVPRHFVSFHEMMEKGSGVSAVTGKVKALEKADNEAKDAVEREARKKKYVMDVPFYNQKEYPTGCELVSTSMLLAYYGIDVSVEDFIKKGYVKTREVYLDEKGDPYGPDPDMYFIGDPLADNGFGCFSGTIIKALKKILPEDEYEIVDLKGMEVDDICDEYINNDIPVIFWGGLNMEHTYYEKVNHWFIEEGDRAGEEFKWYSNEHCLVLVGHDPQSYYFNDPNADKPAIRYGRAVVELRYLEMGKQAVAVIKK